MSQKTHKNRIFNLYLRVGQKGQLIGLKIKRQNVFFKGASMWK